MKLYYYRDPRGNFGDDLNPWLWPRLLPPGTLDDDATSLFVGIGTLLGKRIPRAPTKWVMGSGTGYSQFPPLDDTWNFMCVRGPLTAKALGLAPELAATDPAALLHRLPGLTDMAKTHVSFMPHHVSIEQFDWGGLCDRVGVQFIDPRAAVDGTLATLAQSKLVITESLHGAIVADALRIPWIPVVCYDHILAFKWMDWAASLDVSYVPHPLPSLHDRETGISTVGRAHNVLKRALRSFGVGRKRWAQVPEANSSNQQISAAAKQLESLARTGVGSISTDSALSGALAKLDAAIARLLTEMRSDAPGKRPSMET